MPDDDYHVYAIPVLIKLHLWDQWKFTVLSHTGNTWALAIGSKSIVTKYRYTCFTGILISAVLIAN